MNAAFDMDEAQWHQLWYLMKVLFYRPQIDKLTSATSYCNAPIDSS
jgi:hypothetical protein